MAEKLKEQWAIVELFGHSRIAGKISEQVIGGCSFVRVDVPGAEGHPAFTKLYGQGAIYAISFVDEETARFAAQQMEQTPIDEWSARRMIESKGLYVISEVDIDSKHRQRTEGDEISDEIPY